VRQCHFTGLYLNFHRRWHKLKEYFPLSFPACVNACIHQISRCPNLQLHVDKKLELGHQRDGNGPWSLFRTILGPRSYHTSSSYDIPPQADRKEIRVSSLLPRQWADVLSYNLSTISLSNSDPSYCTRPCLMCGKAKSAT
jgi:hypothetical protein